MDDIEAWKEVHQHLTIAITLTKDSIHEEKAKRRLLLEELYNHLKPDGTSKWIQNSNKIKKKTKKNNEKGGTATKHKRKLSRSSSGGGKHDDDGISTKQQSKSSTKTTKKASSSDQSDSVKKKKKSTNSPKKEQENEKMTINIKSKNIGIAGLGETNVVDYERKSFTVPMSPIISSNRSITQGNNTSSNISEERADQEVVTSHSVPPESALYDQHNIANNEHDIIKKSTSIATPTVTSSSSPFQQFYPATSPKVQNNTQSSTEMNYFHNPIPYSILDARAIDAAAAVASALTAQPITSSLSITPNNNESGSANEYYGKDTFDSTKASESLMPSSSESQNMYKKDDDG